LGACPAGFCSVNRCGAGYLQWTNELIGNASGDDRGLLLLYKIVKIIPIFISTGCYMH
jgi:hypothetical protein